MSHFAEVTRSCDPKGPGVLKLYKETDGDPELLGEWKCITGGEQTDPAKYGGITPPIEWVMVEEIKMRKHPQGHTMEFARIIPLGAQKAEYEKRTFDINRWPFMVHVAGSSSGCIAILPEDWKACVGAMNAAYKEGTFTIYVEEGPSPHLQD